MTPIAAPLKINFEPLGNTYLHLVFFSWLLGWTLALTQVPCFTARIAIMACLFVTIYFMAQERDTRLDYGMRCAIEQSIERMMDEERCFDPNHHQHEPEVQENTCFSVLENVGSKSEPNKEASRQSQSDLGYDAPASCASSTASESDDSNVGPTILTPEESEFEFEPRSKSLRDRINELKKEKHKILENRKDEIYEEELAEIEEREA